MATEEIGRDKFHKTKGFYSCLHRETMNFIMNFSFFRRLSTHNSLITQYDYFYTFNPEINNSKNVLKKVNTLIGLGNISFFGSLFAF